jgi:hypothetical protein
MEQSEKRPKKRLNEPEASAAYLLLTVSRLGWTLDTERKRKNVRSKWRLFGGSTLPQAYLSSGA